MERERLQRLLGGAELARLRQQLARKLLRDGGGRLSLSRVSDAERTAIERLIGRSPRQGRSLRIDLGALSQTLSRAGVAADLRSALETLDGPLVDPRAEREAQRRCWMLLIADYRQRANALGLEEWLEALQAGGLLKRLAGGSEPQGRALLEQALTVLERLPVRGLTLSTLAADCLGDAHALDAGAPVAALVRRALARHWRGGMSRGHTDERSIWAHAGVLMGGDITSAALTLRLPVHPGQTLDKALARYAHQAEPSWLTLRQLLRHAPAWDCAGREIFVCENPAVVAEAAERLGVDCAPLIATWGRPGAAVLILLEQLEAAGAVLHYHGDFDWAGISIANALLERFTMRPWRMSADELRRYQEIGGKSLMGAPIEASWDAELRTVMEGRGKAVHEEQLIDFLLDDLRASGTRHGDSDQA